MVRGVSAVLSIVRAGGRGAPETLNRFTRSEAGALTALSLLFFIMMLMIAGMTLDMMRHESIRTRLQSTADRAVLAAADLDQTAVAEAVVRDYIEKAGMSEYITDLKVTPAVNARTVETSLSVNMPTWFMNMVGIDTVAVNTTSKAEEKVPNIEVALVLDISGSMGDPSAKPGKTKNEVLIEEATTFVTTMLAGNTGNLLDGSGVTSIAIVPYNHSVNIDGRLLSYFTVEDHHDASKCLRFSAAQMASLNMDLTQTYNKIAHFDRNNDDLWEVGGIPTLQRPWCKTDDYGAVMPHSVSLSDLTDKISSLGAQGNTAIDLGIKWGAMMLDPSTRPVINSMIDTGPIAARLNEGVRDRPADYADRETIKVMVVMTDGKNTTQYDLKAPYKSTMSPVFEDPDTGTYSVYFPSQDAYWIPQLTGSGDVDVGAGTWRATPIGEDNAIQLAHKTIFARYNVRFLSEYLFRTNLDDTDAAVRAVRTGYRNAVTGYAGRTIADANAKALCNQLKASERGVKMFTIGFEVPDGGAAETLMQECASLDGDYFDVDGANISQAFSSIADKIQQLRLTH